MRSGLRRAPRSSRRQPAGARCLPPMPTSLSAMRQEEAHHLKLHRQVHVTKQDTRWDPQYPRGEVEDRTGACVDETIRDVLGDRRRCGDHPDGRRITRCRLPQLVHVPDDDAAHDRAHEIWVDVEQAGDPKAARGEPLRVREGAVRDCRDPRPRQANRLRARAPGRSGRPGTPCRIRIPSYRTNPGTRGPFAPWRRSREQARRTARTRPLMSRLSRARAGSAGTPAAG